MANDPPITLTLYEAAEFLKIHWQTLRYKAKAGEVPAAKIGKRWVFLTEDLASYLRSHYSTGRPRSQVQHVGDTLCCSSEKPRVSGGVSLLPPMESEYNSLLKQ